jgi:acetyl esterase/lipase
MKQIKYCLLPILLFAFVSCATTGHVQQQEKNRWTAYDNLSYGAAKEQYVNMTIPNTIHEKTNVIVFIHGYNGGRMENWTFLNKYREDFVTANINYRTISTANNSLTMHDLLTDIDHAVALIKQTAADNSITVNKVIVMGHSLGGFLALNYSYRYFDQDPPIPIAFCVSMSGLSDLADVRWIGLARNPFNWISFKTIVLIASSLTGQAITKDDISMFGFTEPVVQLLKEISPRYSITAGIPPTIIVHDAGDPTVPYSNSASLHGALDAVHAPNILIGTSTGLSHSLGAASGAPTRTINASLEKEMIQAIDRYIELYED